MPLATLEVKCSELKGVYDVMAAIASNIDDVPLEVREAFEAFINEKGRTVEGYKAAVYYSDIIERMNREK